MENAVRISIADAQELIVSLLQANGVSLDAAVFPTCTRYPKFC